MSKENTLKDSLDEFSLAEADLAIKTLEVHLSSLQSSLICDEMASYPFGLEALSRLPNQKLEILQGRAAMALRLIEEIIEAIDLLHERRITAAHLRHTLRGKTEASLQQHLAEINAQYERDRIGYPEWKDLLEQKLAKIASLLTVTQ